MPALRVSARVRRATLLAFVAVFALSVYVPGRASADTVWTKNLYSSGGFMTQDPYSTACVAAAAMMMLNFADLGDTGGNGFWWSTTRVKRDSNPRNHRDMMSILSFARRWDTLGSNGKGSDAHGWRNTLNYFGWGLAAMRDRNLWVYDDRAYGSFASAVKAAVQAIARYDKPVGILGSGGGHAQVMTGYVAVGEDPATSDAFTVTKIYLSDPLVKRKVRNKLISISTFRSGASGYKFRAYRYADSPKDDRYTAGWRYSSVTRSRGPSEWYGRWVIVMPIRAGLPEGEPAPTPTPTPTPEPTPTADPEPTPTADPTPTPAPSG